MYSKNDKLLVLQYNCPGPDTHRSYLISDILDRYHGGGTLSQIARDLGVSWLTIQKIVCQEHLPPLSSGNS